MAGPAFIKMHGLGNDFVVLDARRAPLSLDESRVRAIADRHTGVGCDQLLVLEAPRNGGADAFLSIHNADGDEVAACGNGTRCAAALLMGETGSRSVTLETLAGLLKADSAPGGLITVDMGPARTGWREIPLAEERDTLHLDIGSGPLSDAAAVNVGNPHAVFFVADAEAIDLAVHGPLIEHHPLFPELTNVEAVEVLEGGRLRMRVWERGVGITRACGTGACAALIAASRRGLVGRSAEVVLDGGILTIDWKSNGHVAMTGPVAISFTGTLDPALLA
jgi:diaminopimelate epimerase